MQESMIGERQIEGRLSLAEGLTADIVEWSGQSDVWAEDGYRGTVLACRIAWPEEGRSGASAVLSVGDHRVLRAVIESENRPSSVIVFQPFGIWKSFIQKLEPGEYYLPDDLMIAAIDAVRPRVSGPGRRLYRSGRCQQVISELLDRAERGDLVSRSGADGLSLAERNRIMAARQLICSRFGEKLTLDAVARACGLNKAKLTRGFRTLFNQTVMECLQEDRLQNAARALRTTSEPVSVIGYAAGYLNNASFSRAFSRRFGVSPTEFRRGFAPPSWPRDAAVRFN